VQEASGFAAPAPRILAERLIYDLHRSSSFQRGLAVVVGAFLVVLAIALVDPFETRSPQRHPPVPRSPTLIRQPVVSTAPAASGI